MKRTAQAERALDRAFDREMRPLMIDRPRSWAAWFWLQTRTSLSISRWGDSGEPTIYIFGEIDRIMAR